MAASEENGCATCIASPVAVRLVAVKYVGLVLKR